MKDIIYMPSANLPSKDIIQSLEIEQANHETTHVLGCEVSELITRIKGGMTYYEAVNSLRKSSTSRYATYPQIPLK